MPLLHRLLHHHGNRASDFQEAVRIHSDPLLSAEQV